MRVLVTGGSGFIASHCISALLQSGHEVVFSVRSASKGTALLSAFPNCPTSQLSFVIVPDIATPGAFDDAVRSDPPLDAVLHTASPLHFNITDVKRDMLDPAINGTVGILRSIATHARHIRRVVLTSSMAAMVKWNSAHPEIYNESHYSDLTMAQALNDGPFIAYCASKQFAEKAAWQFMEREKPQFELVTLMAPAVFGPVLYTTDRLESINMSNQTVMALVRGQMKDGVEPSPVLLYVDVRDLAVAHVRALDEDGAAGKRVFVGAEHYRSAEIVDVLAKNFPELRGGLPQGVEALPKEFPYGADNGRSKELLGMEYRTLEESITDAAKATLRLSA
jgi:nucleoside-diphosphate-sugar epimerase